jgi:hypothetical protein
MDGAEVKRQFGRKYAKGRARRTPGEMNGTEAKYAAELEILQRTGQIEWWAFEPIKLKLADRTFYTPDFCVMHNDGTIAFVEVKGHWEDDARVKIKVAAKTFPMFVFVAEKPRSKKNGGGWEREEF